MALEIEYQRDLGRCDDCGSDEGHRYTMLRDITVEGVLHRVEVWVCSGCRGVALAQGNFVGGQDKPVAE